MLRIKENLENHLHELHFIGDCNKDLMYYGPNILVKLLKYL